MDVNQVIVALIGASSTLLAAWVGSRARQKPGTTPSKRSIRRRLIKFAFYFLLGGVATYWVVSWLFPSVHVDERLQALGVNTGQLTRTNVAFAHGKDTMAPPSLPVGSVILSVLPPEQLDRLPGGSTYWAPADGRTLDSSSSYVMLTGSMKVPDLRGVFPVRRVTDPSGADSTSRGVRSGEHIAGSNDSTFHWYIRIN